MIWWSSGEGKKKTKLWPSWVLHCRMSRQSMCLQISLKTCMIFWEKNTNVPLRYCWFFANHQITIDDDVSRLLYFSLAGCTEISLFLQKREWNQDPQNGNQTGSYQQYELWHWLIDVVFSLPYFTIYCATFCASHTAALCIKSCNQVLPKRL